MHFLTHHSSLALGVRMSVNYSASIIATTGLGHWHLPHHTLQHHQLPPAPSGLNAIMPTPLNLFLSLRVAHRYLCPTPSCLLPTLAPPQIIKLTHFCPWKEHLYSLEKELGVDKPILYCLVSGEEGVKEGEGSM